jgi:hypothetical protein
LAAGLYTLHLIGIGTKKPIVLSSIPRHAKDDFSHLNHSKLFSETQNLCKGVRRIPSIYGFLASVTARFAPVACQSAPTVSARPASPTPEFDQSNKSCRIIRILSLPA